jgi:hypothetical protein
MNRPVDQPPFSAQLSRSTRAPAEEALVADARASLTPAQVVEHKLHALLKGTKLPMSRSLASTGRQPAGR